ncbi:hypothetical protein [Lactiplantibacillus carotarum]|uniref:hypothetical protein n=1 Tax=Lactiplantibacillus carotarum TaxID=2993456 RepID=UPI00298F30BF|nr:hypothetical protein [Lactiplantibacillus carotarum]
MPTTKKITYVLAIVLSVIYLIWRVGFTIPWHANWFALIFALLLVGSELLSNFTAFILIFFGCWPRKTLRNSSSHHWIPPTRYQRLI